MKSTLSLKNHKIDFTLFSRNICQMRVKFWHFHTVFSELTRISQDPPALVWTVEPDPIYNPDKQERFEPLPKCFLNVHKLEKVKNLKIFFVRNWFHVIFFWNSPFGNLFVRKGLLADAHVRFNFIKVIQNSSRFTKVSRFGNCELVTPTLLIWSLQAARHSSWFLPTWNCKQTADFF